MELNNINSHCQTIFLEQLDFNGLLNMRNTSQYFATLVDDVFKRLYSTKRIEIDFTTSKKRTYEIRLDNFQLAIKVLQTFGHMIEDLALFYDLFIYKE